MHMSTVGDGRLGYPDGGPYDAIHVGAAAPTVPKAVRTRLLLLFENRIREMMHLFSRI